MDPFPINSIVLVKYSDNAYYEGKVRIANPCYMQILSSKFNEETHQLQYFIHYKGWSAKWDEWVLSESVTLLNETSNLVESENCVIYSKTMNPTETSSKSFLSRQKLSCLFVLNVSSQKYNRIACQVRLSNSVHSSRIPSFYSSKRLVCTEYSTIC